MSGLKKTNQIPEKIMNSSDYDFAERGLYYKALETYISSVLLLTNLVD